MKILLRSFACAAVVAVLALAAPVRAEEDDEKGKGKSKSDAKPTVIQIDLSKLPPDLAKQLMKYASAKPEKGPAPAPAAKKTPVSLPPGLAKKPVDHPGRVNFIKAHSGQAPGKPAAPPTKKKKDKDDDDDEDD